MVLDKKEMFFPVDTSKPFKLNSGTTGFCESIGSSSLSLQLIVLDRVLYTPERLSKIAVESAKHNSIFSFDDRIGIVLDAMALSRSGHARVSSALALVDILRNETECKTYFDSWFSVLMLTIGRSRLGQYCTFPLQY
jgi:aminopeptidase 2